jgi:pimeloyl-ACP methyl ester carboxylesterase
VRTFCLVHGAWHDDACWAPLVALLEARGHRCITPVLPLEDDDASFEDYANVVIESLDGCEPPVLVGHSLSSAVIPLVGVRRPVALLVYLCPAMAGFSAPAGGPPYRRSGYNSPPVDAAGRMYWPRERAITQLYARLDRGSAERLADRLRPQPTGLFDEPYPLAEPPPIRSAFIYTREDELFDDEWSRWIAGALLGVEPLELPGGHFPMLEHTELLADALERVSSCSDRSQ